MLHGYSQCVNITCINLCIHSIWKAKFNYILYFNKRLFIISSGKCKSKLQRIRSYLFFFRYIFIQHPEDDSLLYFAPSYRVFLERDSLDLWGWRKDVFLVSFFPIKFKVFITTGFGYHALNSKCFPATKQTIDK